MIYKILFHRLIVTRERESENKSYKSRYVSKAKSQRNKNTVMIFEAHFHCCISDYNEYNK